MFADRVPRTGRYLAGSMPRVVCTLPSPWCVESLSKCVQIWLAILAAQSDGQHHDSQTPNLALASRSSLTRPDAQTSSSRHWQGQAGSVERAWRPISELCHPWIPYRSFPDSRVPFGAVGVNAGWAMTRGSVGHNSSAQGGMDGGTIPRFPGYRGRVGYHGFNSFDFRDFPNPWEGTRSYPENRGIPTTGIDGKGMVWGIPGYSEMGEGQDSGHPDCLTGAGYGRIIRTNRPGTLISDCVSRR
jgi:hypothetical protein